MLWTASNATIRIALLVALVRVAVADPCPQPRLDENKLDNHSCYANVDGHEVHQPAKPSDGSVPAGATAQCRDSEYSFSEHHSGTCSRHGGVAKWFH